MFLSGSNLMDFWTLLEDVSFCKRLSFAYERSGMISSRCPAADMTSSVVRPPYRVQSIAATAPTLYYYWSLTAFPARHHLVRSKKSDSAGGHEYGTIAFHSA